MIRITMYTVVVDAIVHDLIICKEVIIDTTRDKFTNIENRRKQ